MYPDTPTPSERIDYVIITNEALKPSFNKLLKWKKSKGLYSKIITVEEIESQYSGTDTPLKIKKCLEELFLTKSLKYVLLGGDDKIVPVRYCYGKVNAGTYMYRANDSIPTDLYYACFVGNKDWDSNGNEIYGEVRDDCYLNPMVCVTRVPVRIASEVDAFSTKLIAYETNPNWGNKLLMSGKFLHSHFENHPNSSDAECVGDLMYEEFIKPFWIGERIKFYDTYTDFAEGANYDFSAENLKKQINNGYDFIDINTHGGQTGIQMESGRDYVCDDGSSQSNVGNSIITTMACHTNAFDSTEDSGLNDPCLSESLIRNPLSGIIAYWGCSREGWSRKNELGTSALYNGLFYKTLFNKDFPYNNYGMVAAMAKVEMLPFCVDYGTERWVQFGLNPIGDPEMPIYIDEPQKITNSNVSYSGGKFKINAGGNACRICIMSENDSGESYYKVYDNVEVVEKTDLPSFCSICITKQGFIPQVYKIRIIQNETFDISEDFNYDVVVIGSTVTQSINSGPVTFVRGEYNISANTVYIDPSTEINPGVDLNINLISNSK